MILDVEYRTRSRQVYEMANTMPIDDIASHALAKLRSSSTAESPLLRQLLSSLWYWIMYKEKKKKKSISILNSTPNYQVYQPIICLKAYFLTISVVKRNLAVSRTNYYYKVLTKLGTFNKMTFNEISMNKFSQVPEFKATTSCLHHYQTSSSSLTTRLLSSFKTFFVNTILMWFY